MVDRDGSGNGNGNGNGNGDGQRDSNRNHNSVNRPHHHNSNFIRAPTSPFQFPVITDNEIIQKSQIKVAAVIGVKMKHSGLPQEKEKEGKEEVKQEG